MGALRYNIALIAANILFGASFSAYISLLEDALLPSQLFVIQLLFATLLFTPAALLDKRLYSLTLDDFGSIFIVSLLVVFGWWYLLIEGASHTNPIDASTIATIGPIFTLITSVILHGRQAQRGEKIGIIIALLGVFALLFDRGRGLIGEGGKGYGNALILCAVVATAINTVLIAPVLRRHGTAVVMGLYYLIGATLAMPLIIEVVPTLPRLHLTHLEWAEMAYILLLGSTLPMYLLYVGSEHLTATHTAIYRYIQPLIATTLAVARGQSTIDRTNILGAVLIFTGMLLAVLATPRSERTASATRPSAQ